MARNFFSRVSSTVCSESISYKARRMSFPHGVRGRPPGLNERGHDVVLRNLLLPAGEPVEYRELHLAPLVFIPRLRLSSWVLRLPHQEHQKRDQDDDGHPADEVPDPRDRVRVAGMDLHVMGAECLIMVLLIVYFPSSMRRTRSHTARNPEPGRSVGAGASCHPPVHTTRVRGLKVLLELTLSRSSSASFLWYHPTPIRIRRTIHGQP